MPVIFAVDGDVLYSPTDKKARPVAAAGRLTRLSSRAKNRRRPLPYGLPGGTAR